MRGVLYLLAAALFINSTAFAEVLYRVATIDGIAVHYMVVLPERYDPAKTYPGVLAFAGGGQSIDVVDSMVRTQFQQEAEKRGYIVVSPAAPNGDLFFTTGGEKVIPGLLKKILSDYRIEGTNSTLQDGLTVASVPSMLPRYILNTSFRSPDFQAISMNCSRRD